MSLQQPLATLLDDVYKAASRYVHIYDPQHVDETYLKLLVEPISPEAHAWMSASAIGANTNGYYEDFRHLVPRDKYNVTLCEQRHRLVNQAIDYLLTPHRQDAQESPTATIAVGLRIVCRQTNEATDFLNLYVAIATEFKEIAQTAITESIKAAEHFFSDTKYYVTKIT